MENPKLTFKILFFQFGECISVLCVFLESASMLLNVSGALIFDFFGGSKFFFFWGGEIIFILKIYFGGGIKFIF